jgi:hypothetical protein
MRLDSRDKLPSGLEEYLSMYGWHFSKKLCEFAVSGMKKEGGMSITPYTKEMVDNLLKEKGVVLKNKFGYDYVFVANMAKADYLGSSIVGEGHLAKFVKDYVDDPDGYPELPMSRFYADIVGKGIPIIWEDMI